MRETPWRPLTTAIGLLVASSPLRARDTSSQMFAFETDLP